jgi:radical SAM superfamily enzyme
LIDVGYESVSDENTKNIKKGVTVLNKRFTTDAKKSGLKILADLVIGFPGKLRNSYTNYHLLKD